MDVQLVVDAADVVPDRVDAYLEAIIRSRPVLHPTRVVRDTFQRVRPMADGMVARPL